MSWRVRGSLLVGLIAFYTLFRPHTLLSVDEELLYRTTVALAERGSLWIVPLGRPLEAVIVPKERTAAKYGVLPSLAAVPFYWVGKSLATIAPGALADDVRRAVTASASVVWMAWAVLEFAALVGLLGFSRGTALSLALVLALTTPLLVYSRSFHIVAITTLLTTALVHRAAWYESSPSQNRALVIGSLLGLLILTSLQFVLLLPVLGWYIWRAGDRSQRSASSSSTDQSTDLPSALRRLASLGCFLLAVGLAAILVMGANYLRTDASTWDNWRQNDGAIALSMHLLRGGYAGEHFVTPLQVGLYGLLVSPARGLLWYCPVSILGIICFGRFWRAQGRVAWLVVAILAVIIVSSSKWWAWNGGLNWGPRYLVAVVPLTLVPLAYGFRRWKEISGTGRALAVLLVIVSGIIQLRGATIDHDRAIAPIASLSRGENERWFVPQLSPLWSHVDTEPGLLWNRWVEMGFPALTLAVVTLLALTAVAGIGTAVYATGFGKELRSIFAWPVWGALAGLGLIWGGHTLWLSAGHGLRVNASSKSDCDVQFNRRRWNWTAPAAGPVEWTGYLRVPQNGDFYTILLRADEPAELEVTGRFHLEHPGDLGRWSVWNGRLDEGLYPLTLRSTPSGDRPARVSLTWTIHGSSIDRQPISPAFLYPDPPSQARLLVDRALAWSWYGILIAGLFLLGRAYSASKSSD